MTQTGGHADTVLQRRDAQQQSVDYRELHQQLLTAALSASDHSNFDIEDALLEASKMAERLKDHPDHVTAYTKLHGLRANIERHVGLHLPHHPNIDMSTIRRQSSEHVMGALKLVESIGDAEAASLVRAMNRAISEKLVDLGLPATESSRLR